MKITKSPTRSEQENQSGSSEDTNVTQFFFENFENKEDNSSTAPTYGCGNYTKEKGKKKEPALSTGNCRWLKSEKSRKIKYQQM